MFFRRIFKTSQVKNTWIEDVTISTKSKVLSLRPNYFVIKIDKQKIRELFGKEKYFIGYGLVILLVLAVSSFSNPTKADIVNFYPTSCLGGWENPENATGAPSLEEDESIESFNEENSTRMRGSSDIFCGGFEGDIPPDAIANSFSLSFRISVDDGSVEHKKSEVLVVPETEDVRVGTDNIEIIEIDSTTEGNQTTDSSEILEESIDGESTPSTTPEESVIEIPSDEVVPVESSPEPEAPSESTQPEESSEQAPDSTGESAFMRFFTKIVHAEGEDSSVIENIPEDRVVDTSIVEVDLTDTQTQETQEVAEIDVSSSEVINIDRPDTEDAVSESEEGINEDSTSNEPEVVPNDAILKITYTLDGEKWTSLGYISMSSWKDLKFSLPLEQWSDMSSFQVKLEQISTYDEKPVVFLDSIIVSAEYDGLGEDPIRQPDFGSDVILLDKTVEDIRVIKVLRGDVPMIWYTRIPPPVELPEGEVIEEQEGIEIISLTEDSVPIGDEVVPEPEDPVETLTEDQVVPPVESLPEILPTEATPEIIETIPVVDTEIISFRKKIKNLFGVLQVYAEGEDGGGESGDSSSGGESSSGSDSGSAPDVSTESPAEENNSTSSDSDSIASDSVEESISVSEGDSASVDSDTSTENQINDSINEVLDDINIGESGNIIINSIQSDNIDNILITEDLLLSTTEGIVPGLTPVIYTEEQIMSERASGTEWNLVAVGESVDVTTTVDVSGGIIFWFAPGNTAIYQYNTASGGVSSETISTTVDSEVKFLEPNGDVSEVSIDTQDGEIITPKEEEDAEQEASLKSEEINDKIISVEIKEEIQ